LNRLPESSPLAFKGIALFTPGGDVVYCIDPKKQNRWHVQLCGLLQYLLNLPELPHFLVPSYAATLDRTIDPHSQHIQDIAELSPLLSSAQPILNAIFQTHGLVWQEIPLAPQLIDPVVLTTYRSQFPQLWENHDLVVRYQPTAPTFDFPPFDSPLNPVSVPTANPQGYVFRLFVAGSTTATERTLQKLHQLLEDLLTQPYTLRVIDVTQHPDLAEQDHVTATPTLVRVHPLPLRRLVGNFDSVEQLLGILSNFEHRPEGEPDR